MNTRTPANCSIFTAALFLSLCGTALAQPAKKPATPKPAAITQITSVDQPTRTLTAGMATALTFHGKNLDDVTEVRVAQSGKAAGWKVTKSGPSESTLAVRIQAPASVAAGQYQVELHVNNAWITTSASIKIVATTRPRLIKPGIKRPELRFTGTIPAGLAKVRKLFSENYLQTIRAKFPAPSTGIGGEIVPHFTPLNPDLKIDHLGQMGLSDIDFVPKSSGALGGLFNVTGKGLSNVDAIKLNGQALELITRNDTSIVARFPSGVQTIEGTLALSRGTQTAILVTRYRAVDQWQSFQPKIQARFIPYAPSQLPFTSALADAAYRGATYFLDLELSEIPGVRVTVRPTSGFERVEPVFSNERELEFNQIHSQFLGRVTGDHIKVTVTGSDPSTTLSKNFEIEVPVQVLNRTTYTIENTWDLKPYWGWEKTESWGVTEGKSETPAGSVNVGMLEVSDDIAFRIASGPVGTAVTWRSKLTSLQNGWTVESMEWVETVQFPDGDTPKARATSADKTRANSPDQSVSQGASNDLLTNYIPGTYNSDPVLLRPYNKSENDDYIWRKLMIGFDLSDPDEPNAVFYTPSTRDWLRSMYVKLDADNTLFNNHRVTVRLKKVVLKGPPNADWHDAFASSKSQEDELLYNLMPPREIH